MKALVRSPALCITITGLGKVRRSIRLFKSVVIQVVRRQYGINATTVALARERLNLAFQVLSPWQEQDYLCGDRLTIADITAAALLSPLALLPEYRQSVPWLFDRIKAIHVICGEPLPQRYDAIED